MCTVFKTVDKKKEVCTRENWLIQNKYTIVEKILPFVYRVCDEGGVLHYICLIEKKGNECDFCGFQTFNLVDMLRHLVKYHGIKDNEIIRQVLKRLSKNELSKLDFIPSTLIEEVMKLQTEH